MNSRNRKSKVSERPVLSTGMTEEEVLRAHVEQVNYEKQQIGATLAVLMPTVAFQLDQLQSQVYKANQLQGFWDFDQDNTPSKIALMHSELSEALEAYRKNIENDDKIPEFTGVEAELADAVIRILDFAGRHNLRLGAAIQAKLLFNLTREYKHGKAC